MKMKNGGFEEDWGVGGSHTAVLYRTSGELIGEQEIGNIFTPPGWETWFIHEPGVFDQPEVRDAHKTVDGRRVRSGEKAILLFTFFRKHCGGFLQRVQVVSGQMYRLTAWAHAWSNGLSANQGGHPDDGLWSDGAGYGVVSWTQAEIPPLCGAPQDDAKGNFEFSVGIDPTGGDNPLADTVVWSEPRFNYNGYVAPLEVTAVASSSTITVFLCSETLWSFKHNDAYWDDAVLEEVGGTVIPPCRGSPRVQYERTYVLLPPDATQGWVDAVAAATWSEHRYTVGGSADDAGIGDLDVRRVIAVNPGGWPGSLADFYRQHYPGVVLEEVYASSPSELVRLLSAPPGPPATTCGHVGLHLQTMVAGALDFIRDLKPPVVKVFQVENALAIKQASPDTRVVFRHHLDQQGWYRDHPDKMLAARHFISLFRDSLTNVAGQLQASYPSQNPVLYVETALNEEYECDQSAKNQASMAFDIAFCDALAELGLPVAPVVFAAPVGNPQVAEAAGLAPLARKCVQHKGLVGPHPYWRADHGQSLLSQDWLWYAGRWVQFDQIWKNLGIEVTWFGGESGVYFSSHEGWRSPNCYSGDFSKYLADIMEFDRLCKVWNAVNSNRFLGAVLFTSGSGTGWDSFQVGASEMAQIASALRTNMLWQ